MSRLNRSGASPFLFIAVVITLAIFSLTLSVPLFAQELIPADKVLPVGAVNSATAETAALTPEQIAQQRERFQQQMQDLWAKGLTVSVTDDASHRAIVYSSPGPEAEAIRKGTHREWLQRVNDPGYLMQQLRRREPAAGPEGFYWLARLQQELARGSGQAQRQVLPAYGPQTVPAASSETRDWNISLGAAGVAPAQYAAKFDYNGGYPSCTLDYAVFPVDAAGSSTQAMLVGVNNLYDFCTGTRPAVKFAYYYSTGGTVKTSPTISNDGTKIVFLESRTNASILHILTLGTTGSNGASAVNPVLPGTGNNASDFGIELSGGVSVTRSFPYYDFNSDSVYVGDDVGKLHYITPVFCPGATTCSPAEVTAGGWPVTVHSGAVLSAPIHDPVSLNAFVGDSSGNAYYVRTTGSTTGTCAAGGIPCVGTPTVTVGAGGNYGGLVDTPLADIFAGMVWFATGQSVAGTCTTSGAPVVLQVTTALAPEAAACLGIGGVNNVHLGGFDYAYYNSPVSGHLWWAGNDATYGVPALWAMNFNASNVMITPVEKGAISSAAVDASPLTESYDGWTGKDWLSFSVPANSCGGTGATGGCLATYSLVPGVSPASELPWLSSWGYVSGAEIIDTNGNVEQASGLGTILGPTGATPPVWGPVVGNMVTEGTNADATGTGTFTANTAVGGQYVTVDGVTLTAATPTAATTIGTFTADPSPLTAAISITAASGSPTVSFTPANSTGASATGTFTADPTSGSVTITQPNASSVCTTPPCAMTLAVSPGAAATATGTFTSSPSSGTVAITNGANVMNLVANSSVTASATGTFAGVPANGQTATVGGSDAVTASGGVKASGTGTFTGDPNLGSTITITNGAASETLTPSPGTAATAMGTFSANPTGGAVRITDGANSMTLVASATTQASATGTFAGVPTNGQTATVGGTDVATASAGAFAGGTGTFTGDPNLGSTITITNGASSESLMPSPGTAATAMGTFTANPTGGSVRIINGTNNLTLVPSFSTQASATGTFSGVPTNGQTATVGGTDVVTASAELNACATGTFAGNTNIGSIISITNGANTESLTPNASLNATASGTFTGIPVSGQAFTITDGANVLIMKAAAANACATSKGGTFNIGASAAAAATNLNTALNTCPAAVGVTSLNPVSAGVTVTSRVAGPAGNSIALQTYTVPPAFATGTVKIITDPYTWPNHDDGPGGTDATVTIGAITYTFRSPDLEGLTANNQVLTYDLSTAATDEAATAQNLLAALANNQTLCSAQTGQPCFQATAANPSVTGTRATNTDTLTANTLGTAGNFALATNYATGITVAGGANGANGTAGAMTNFSWTASTGTPPCNGSNNPCDLGGGVNGVTSATTYAIDGVAADNATQFAAAVNSAPNPGNVGVVATVNSNVVTVCAVSPGSAGNSITLGSNAVNFTWSPAANLAGGNDVSNVGNFFAITDGSGAALTTTQIASNFAADLTRNIGAVAINPVTSAANVDTVTATALGPAGNGITLASTLSNFTWNPATSLGGGANGVNTGVNFLVDGVLADDATNLAAAITRNTSVNVPVTGSSSGAVVTVVDTTGGVAGNSIALSLPAGTPATGSFSFTAQPASELSNADYPGLDAGNVVWWFEAAVGSTCTGSCTNTDYSERNAEGYSTILIGNTVANTVLNVVAALNNNPALCGYKDPTTTDTGYNTCYQNGTATDNAGVLPPQAFMTASGSASTVTLNATVLGTGGNCTGTCWTSYGWSSNDTLLGTGGDNENMSAATGGLSGGTTAMITGYSWTSSTGTPPCNGTNNPCNMGGGANGVTSATTYAIDGVAADDATQLAAAINTAPNPANVGVAATSAGPVVTVKASSCGTAGNSITLAKTATNFAWSGTNLTGGNTALNTGVDFAVTDTTTSCAPLTTTQIASNFAADLTRNIGAVAINPVTSAANVDTVTATAFGTSGNGITLASTLSNFTWNPATSLGGGVTGINTGVNFMVDGVLADDATNLAAAITRNTSVNVPVTGSSSGAVVTVVDTTGGVAGNSIALSLPAGTPATGSFSFTAQPASELSNADYPGLDAGNVVWWFEAAVGSTCTGSCTNTDYSERNAEGYSTILIGNTVANTVLNVVAALNNNPALCGYKDPTTTDTGYNTCYQNGTATDNAGVLPPQAFMTASGSASTVTLNATVLGTGGNCTGTCWTSYGWSSNDTLLGTGGDNENISAATGGLSGGSSAMITGYSWTSSTGTPPCNGTNNPCNMGGGANGVTSATTYAIDGVAADDATQLAAAINTAPNPANVGVTATSAAGAVAVAASACGTAGNSITLAKTATNFTWSGTNLTGGNTASNTGVDFAVTDTTVSCAPLTTTTIAQNFAAALTRNVGAVAINPVTSAANVATVTATTPGAAGNSITLGSTLSNFTWNPAATLGGGSTGSNTGLYFLTDGILTDNAANLAAAITRNTSAAVPVIATPSGPSVTVTDTVRGVAGNSIALSLPATTAATGSFTLTAQPQSYCSGSTNSSYIVLGDLEFFFASQTDTTDTPNCFVYWNNTYATGYPGVLIGDTLAHTAQNLAAAINKSPMSACGYTDPITTDSTYGECYSYTGAVNPYMTASASSTTVSLTAKVMGTGGNCTGACDTTYGWDNFWAAVITPLTGGLSGGSGTGGTITGFSWTASTGTPPCNGANNPCDMGGGVAGVTSATSFATDGLLADDATNLATAIGLGNTANNVGVGATSSGAVVTVTAAPHGTVGDSIVVGPATQPATLAWSCGTTPCALSGGTNGVTTATTYAIDGVPADNAGQLTAAINNAANAALGVAATQGTGSNTCGTTTIASNQFCLAATTPGTTGNSVAVSSGHAGTAATGSFTLTAQPPSEYSNAYWPGVDAGDVTWLFECATGSTATGTCPATDYTTENGLGYSTILLGNTLANTIKNVAAAISNNQGLCGYKDPTTTDTGYNTCFHNGTTICAGCVGVNPPQTYLTATSSGASVALTATVVGTAGNGGTYTTYGWESNDTRLGTGGGNNEHLSPVSGGLSGGVNSTNVNNYSWNPAGLLAGGTNGTTTGTTFQVWSGAAQLPAATIATNFATTIRLNGTLNPLMTATTASVTSPVVTLQARTCGLQGDYALGAGNLSGFNWSGAAMTGGACVIQWTNQGAGNGQSVLAMTGGTSGIIGDSVSYPAWQASHLYQLNATVTDSNGNAEKVVVPGTSGASAPTWNATQGGVTHDGTVTWTNLGMEPTANLNFSSGTSGYQLSLPALQ